MKFTTIKHPEDMTAPLTQDKIAGFLFKHLDQYGDKLEDINRCIDYSMSKEKGMGGYILVAHENEKIAGIVVINKTAMEGYIPGNLLVYIAVNRDFRGQGIGKQLMKETIDHTPGDIALHVEPDNPARKLYEKVGFTSKYIEMRYTR